MPQGLKMKLGGAGEQIKGRAGAFQIEFRKESLFLEDIYTCHEKNLLHVGHGALNWLSVGAKPCHTKPF